MDERIHEHTMPSNATCPSAGPTTLFATTTSSCFQNPIPHQGVMNTQQEIIPAPPQMGQYQNPGPNQPRNPVDRNILLTSEEEILLQTCGRQYGVPPDSTPTTSEEALATFGQPLMIPRPNTEPNPSHTSACLYDGMYITLMLGKPIITVWSMT
jgi:hypothetical protein